MDLLWLSSAVQIGRRLMQNVSGTGQDLDPSFNSCQMDVTMTIDDPYVFFFKG